MSCSWENGEQAQQQRLGGRDREPRTERGTQGQQVARRAGQRHVSRYTVSFGRRFQSAEGQPAQSRCPQL